MCWRLGHTWQDEALANDYFERALHAVRLSRPRVSRRTLPMSALVCARPRTSMPLSVCMYARLHVCSDQEIDIVCTLHLLFYVIAGRHAKASPSALWYISTAANA